MSAIKTVFRYGRYLINAKSRYEVHSPFVFDFINEVLRDSRHYYAFDEIEYRRSLLLKDESVITVEDFGAGSKINKTPERKVSAIAKNTLITPKFGQMLFRMVGMLRPETVLEIGTSLGISTLYLAKAAPTARIISLEGSSSVAELAIEQFTSLQVENIQIITGEFSSTLPKALSNLGKIDIAFIDGNHRFAPTVQYFEQIKPFLHSKSVLIFDDIHWSDEMEQAWNAIKADPSVTLSIDLFYKGIVFFDAAFHSKQHLVLHF